MIGDLLPTRAGCALLVAGTALLGACTVDPYTGAVVPCCGPGYAGYSAAGYPAAGPPGGGAPQGPPPGAEAGQAWGGPGAQGGAEFEGGSEFQGGGRGGHHHLMQRFATANVTQDGRLTLQQAEAANWRRVARNFYDIDVQHKGFVTVDDIRSWRAAHKGSQGGGRGGGFGGQGGGYGGPGGGYGGPGGGYGGPGGGGGGYGYPGGGGYPGQGGPGDEY